MPVQLNDLSVNCRITNKEVVPKVINAGVGGNTTKDLLKRIDKDVLAQNPDLVIMMVGTNDMLNSKKMIDYKKYISNLEVLIQKIKETGSELILMSPIPADSKYLFERHDKSLFNETPNQKIDKVGDIVENLAKKNGVHFYDLNTAFKKLNVPEHNQDLLIRNPKNSRKKDGVHPTALGYRFIAQNVYQFLLEKEIAISKNKIICFGDSITHGGDKGRNYPTYLNELIVNVK